MLMYERTGIDKEKERITGYNFQIKIAVIYLKIVLVSANSEDPDEI